MNPDLIAAKRFVAQLEAESMKWNAALHSVPGHGHPLAAFLDDVLGVVKTLPDTLFEPNAHTDVYSLLAPVLGPWSSTAHRRAAMCEALIVDAGFESDWNFHESWDTTNPEEAAHDIQKSCGAWQISADSMALDPSLRAFIVDRIGSDHVAAFIPAMKTDKALEVEYAIRLFRVSYRWSGPAIHGHIAAAVSRDAVAEWQTALVS